MFRSCKSDTISRNNGFAAIHRRGGVIGLQLKDFTIKKIDTSVKSGESSKFIKSYLELFNSKENLRYLSFTQIPFSPQFVSNWFSQAEQAGVEYHSAFNKNQQIVAISVIKKNSVEGFELLGIVVHPEYQRRGIGNGLIQYAMKLAVADGYRVIDVSVFTDNKPMLLLVIQLDFIPTRISHRLRSDGCDLLHLRKYL